MKSGVLIVGAGMAGLCCALRLREFGVDCLILEASDGVGGRVRTDLVNGFRLDRGFQVLQSAYPEVRSQLRLGDLGLQCFEPGALVRRGGAFHPVADPWRRPTELLRAAFSPVGSPLDKLRLARLRGELAGRSVEQLLSEPETSTLEALHRAGFSEAIIHDFFRPFFGGVFLEADLSTSSRMFRFLFKMFSEGEACLPAEGMGAIPEQLARRLPAGTIRLNTPVRAVRPNEVSLTDGETLSADAVIIATEAPAASRLLGLAGPDLKREATCLYFAAARAPIEEPVLVLNAEGDGPVNNVCVPSVIAPSYAPAGRHLISTTVLGCSARAEDGLEAAVRRQMSAWFGSQVEEWRHLATYRIRHALPAFEPGVAPIAPNPSLPGIFLAGDYRESASLNGAMRSGRLAADAVLANRP